MERIKKYCKEGMTPYPMINFTETHFYVVFKQSREYLKLSKKEREDNKGITQKTVEKPVEKILSLIIKNQQITQKELITKTGLSRCGVEWNLKKLKDENKLKRIGPDKGGYWKGVEKRK